jgi:hypothetical protein
MLRLAALLCLTSAVAHAQSPESAPPQYDLDLRADIAARALQGHARIVVTNSTAAPLGELWLWRYPERFRRRSPALNDYNFYWVYPRSFNPGGMEASRFTVDGRAVAVEERDHPQAGARTLWRVPLSPPLAPGGSVTVEVDYRVRAPERFGPFGCYRKRCLFGGGAYPMLAPLGQPLTAMPGGGRYRVRLWVKQPSDVIINGRGMNLAAGERREVDLGLTEGCALLVAPPRLRQYVREQNGVKIVLHTEQTRGVPSPPEQLMPYQPADRVDRTLAAAADAVALLAEIGVPMPAGERIDLVQEPLRIELAQPEPGMILVSDRLFDIFPLQRFLKFHDFELARAIYEGYLRRRMAAREAPDDLSWSPGVGAAYLVDLYTVRSYSRAEFMREILSWADFIPAVDRILYAPQVPFASTYFYTLADPDPLRDAVAQFNHVYPTGKTIYSKLRDLLGERAVDRIVRAMLDGAPLRPTAEREHGATLDWFFKQWLGPYPPVDYRFVDVRSQKRQKGSWLHTARVIKLGAAPPVEPVEVRAVDKRGNVETQVWDGQGRTHDFAFNMEAPLSTIEIDPRGRLVEDLPGSNDDLKFDDRRPPRWKFIYNNFGGLVYFFPTLGLDLSLDFSLSRILDLKHSLRFFLYRSQSTQVGLSASYTRAYGRKVTAARLTSAWTGTLGIGRIDPTFGQALGAGSKPNPGTQLSASLSWGYDDRLFVWEPLRALSLGASAGVTETVLDDRTVLSQGTVSAGWESIVPVADGHGFAFSLSSAITFGDLSIARQMLSAGGAGGLRGYDLQALLGRWRVNGRVEYRQVYVHDLNINLLHVLYVRGIGGGLFAEGGVVSPCESYAPDAHSGAFDVGYTIRVFGDWFGASQTTLNIDLAVPLTRASRGCFGPAVPTTPFGFYFAFGPPW